MFLGHLTLATCVFTANRTEIAYNASGGAVHVLSATATIDDCTFTGNSAPTRGGAVSTVDTRIRRCTFTSNTAGQEGGAVWAGASELTDCSFVENASGINGGGVSGTGLVVRRCTFEGNTAEADGGGLDGSAQVSESSFIGNAASRGGAVFDDTEIVVADSEFRSNEANIGGALYLRHAEATVDACTLADNSAVLGGAAYCDELSPVFRDTTFSGNIAALDGGAIYNDAGHPSMVRCSFLENRAVVDGGGVYSTLGAPTLTDCSFSGNRAFDDGAGVYSASDHLVMTRCVLEDNSTNASGTVYARISDTTILDSIFRENRVGTYGGGVYQDGGSLHLERTTFSENRAFDGGGALVTDGAAVIRGCDFLDNYARGLFGPAGGAMLITPGSAPQITDCTFDRNEVEDGSPQNAAVFNDEGVPVFLRCRFGAAYSLGGVSSSVLSDRGGALFRDCTFDSGDIGSGAIANIDSVCIATNCTFRGATELINSDNSAVQLTNVTILGGPYLPTVRSAATNTVIANSIVRTGAGSPFLNEGGATTMATYSNIEGGWPGAGNIDVDPLHVDGDAGDYRLRRGSPCIDAGDNAAVPPDVEFDIAGRPRFVDDPDTPDTGRGEAPLVDMGAHEFQADDCLGDVNGDGVVGVPDLIALLRAWGSCPGCPEDLDASGTVDFGDILLVLAGWGSCP